MVVTNTTVLEDGTAVLECTFTDEEGTVVVLNSLTWSLVTKSGAVVNSRSGVTITPELLTKIKLTGADLNWVQNAGSKRYIVLIGTYNSVTNGSNLPYTDQIEIDIEKLKTTT